MAIKAQRLLLGWYREMKMQELRVNPLVRRNGSWIYLNPEDESVSYRVLLGWYEDHVTALFERLMESVGTVVDVGANIGWYTLLAAKHGKRVFAFEPDPVSYSHLQRSISANHYSNVVSRDICLSNRDGQARLYLTDSKNKGLHSIVMRVGSKSLEVPCEKLDTIFPTETIDLLKIDAEYAEAVILDGARRMLTEGRVRNIILEWSPVVWTSKTDLLNGFKAVEIETGKEIEAWPNRSANLFLKRTV